MTKEQGTKKRLPSLRLIGYLAIICVMTIGGFLAGWWLGERSRAEAAVDIARKQAYKDLFGRAFERRSLTFAQVQKITRMRFPKGTELVNGESYSWLEPWLYAKLRMSESAYKQVTAMPQLAGKLSSTDRHEVVDGLAGVVAGISWWKPDSITHFVAAERDVRINPDVTEMTYILIDADADSRGMHVMYLYWTNTE